VDERGWELSVSEEREGGLCFYSVEITGASEEDKKRKRCKKKKRKRRRTGKVNETKRTNFTLKKVVL